MRDRTAIMKLFLGTHPTTIDRKGRVSIPAKWRRVIAARSPDFDGFVAFPSLACPCLEGWTAELLEQMSERTDPFDLLQAPAQDFNTQVFGSAEELGLQEGGRVVLPARLAEAAGIADRLLFHGQGKTFQIWAPDRFEAWQAERPQGGRA